MMSMIRCAQEKMSMDPLKPEFVYIMGTARSGTTVLEILLGATNFDKKKRC
jgi:hypothetical protein